MMGQGHDMNKRYNTLRKQRPSESKANKVKRTFNDKIKIQGRELSEADIERIRIQAKKERTKSLMIRGIMVLFLFVVIWLALQWFLPKAIK